MKPNESFTSGRGHRAMRSHHSFGCWPMDQETLMAEDTPESILIPKSEYLKSIIEACNNGAAAERQGIKTRLIEIRELTPAGSEASLALTKWI